MSVWKSIVGLCAVLGCASGVTSAVWAEEGPGTETSQPAIPRRFPEGWTIYIPGWVDGGDTFNGSSPVSRVKGAKHAGGKERAADALGRQATRGGSAARPPRAGPPWGRTRRRCASCPP